mgnify:CR=1 FL=1
MTLKAKFINYCELQRSANSVREVKGIDDPDTVDAYMKANQVKRELLNMIDEIESK